MDVQNPNTPEFQELSSTGVTIVNFYVFKGLTDLVQLRQTWREKASSLGLLGTILLAPEGVNCALAGERSDLEIFLDFARSKLGMQALSEKWSFAPRPPFGRLKVRLKKWIIRFAEASDPSVEAILTAPRMTPQQVHQLLSQKGQTDVVVIDTRNDYETEVGAFEGAVKLPIKTFTEFPEAFLEKYQDQKDKTFLFYCTGGVRCEKVVPWAMAQGFTKSTQLEGGILRYFEEIGGEGYDQGCFVFDDRVLLGADLDIKPYSGSQPLKSALID